MRLARVRSFYWYASAALFLVFLAHPLTDSIRAQSAAQTQTKDAPFVVEYYYKAKWGHANEFIALFKKNHYPLLKREIELGRILKVFATVPRFHATEDGRWDFRTTIVFKNAQIANDNFDTAPLLKQMFPDQQAYEREEQRRFEILDAHWDVPIKDYDLDTH